MSKVRARKVDKAIRLTYESLESHLDYTHTYSISENKEDEEEDYKFHKKCVMDYARLILLISQLY